MTLFSEKVLISNRCISGLMSYLIKKSWTDSTPDLLGKSLVTHSFFPDLSIDNLAAIFLCRNIYRNKSRNLLTLLFHLYIMCFRTPQEASFLVGQGPHTLQKNNRAVLTKVIGFMQLLIGILLPNCSIDWEKVLKFEAEGREFSKFLSSFKQWKVRTILVTEWFFNLFLEVFQI